MQYIDVYMCVYIYIYIYNYTNYNLLFFVIIFITYVVKYNQDMFSWDSINTDLMTLHIIGQN